MVKTEKMEENTRQKPVLWTCNKYPKEISKQPDLALPYDLNQENHGPLLQFMLNQTHAQFTVDTMYTIKPICSISDPDELLLESCVQYAVEYRCQNCSQLVKLKDKNASFVTNQYHKLEDARN